MFGPTRRLWIQSSLLFGGLLCLALAAPSAVRAAAPPQQDSPEVLVQKLEKAVKARHDRAIATILADTPDNQGREELLAFFAENQAAGVLEYTLQERFGMGEKVEMKSWWKDARIEIVSKTVVCDVTELQLRASWKEEDGSPTTREAPAYVDFDGKGLVLPEGFFGLSAEDSRVVTDLDRYQAKLYDRMTEELSHGKYNSRQEVLTAIADDLRQAEPMKRYMTRIVAPEVGKTLGKALAEALKEAFQEALKKATLKAAQP